MCCCRRTACATSSVCPAATPAGWRALKVCGVVLAVVAALAWPGLTPIVSAGILKDWACWGMIR
ncbi:hypothetical protein D3C76_218160 [compost metagenome]